MARECLRLGWLSEDNGPHKSQGTIFCILDYSDSENMQEFYVLFSSCHSLRKFLTAYDMEITEIISKHTLDFNYMWNLLITYVLK